jgi:peroxiredoxin
MMVASSCNRQPAGQDQSQKNPAERVLRQVADFYVQLDSFQVDGTHNLLIQGPEKKHAMASESTIVVQRPNRLAMRQKQGAQGIDLICDGEHLFVYVPTLQRYTEEKAPATFQEMLHNPTLARMGAGSPFFLNLLAADPYQAMTEGVTSSSYVGQEKIDGTTAHHVKLVQKDLDWDLWVAAGPQPLVLRQVMDMTKAVKAQGQAPEGTKVTTEQTYKNWKVNVNPSADAFAFRAPEGTQKVENLLGEEHREQRSPLVGQPAPDIALKLLDGGQWQLKNEQGKRLVMIDFWATWCGPCVRELPLLAEVAAAYRDKGVAFYAINQQEEAGTIREFLEKRKIDVPVALDSHGAAADSYGVQGIPFLVLIDKKGIVQSVHVGYSPQITTILKEELDALLAGKDLAAPSKANTRP